MRGEAEPDGPASSLDLLQLLTEAEPGEGGRKDAVSVMYAHDGQVQVATHVPPHAVSVDADQRVSWLQHRGRGLREDGGAHRLYGRLLDPAALEHLCYI